MGRQEIIFAFKVREKVEWIKRHGCHRKCFFSLVSSLRFLHAGGCVVGADMAGRLGCGSCPVHTGNDGSMGEVTINFVFNGCGNGVCRPYDRV